MPLTVMKMISLHLNPEQLAFFYEHVKHWERSGIVYCANKLPLPPLVNALVGLCLGMRHSVAGLSRGELSKVSKLCFHRLVQEIDRL